MGASGFAEFANTVRLLLTFWTRSQLKRMSSASRGLAFTGAFGCQVTPWRILNVSCVLSGENSHDSMRSGTTLFSDGFRIPASYWTNQQFASSFTVSFGALAKPGSKVATSEK